MSTETITKLNQIMKLSAQIQEAKERLAENPTVQNALDVQNLQRRRAELQGLLPALRAVN